MPSRPRRATPVPVTDMVDHTLPGPTSTSRTRPRSRPRGDGAAPAAAPGPTNGQAEGFAYGPKAWDELDDERMRERRIEQGQERFPAPEDRGKALLSPMGDVEYVHDLIRPGRIVVVAAEEGTGKSYAMSELAIRVALAGGDFAGTWPVVDVGTVLILSEMHPDDDYEREERILIGLGRQRVELVGGLYRLPLMTAAGGAPVLTDEAWRAYIASWCGRESVKLLIFDTATGATQVEPWGERIQAVYRNLRLMLGELPQLAIVLVVHLAKPRGRGRRALSDVLGEWGRWCDVVLLMEADGAHRVKLSSRKRVKRERWILATKRDGLLVEPMDLAEAGPKVPLEQVVAAIAAEPGITKKGLADTLGVSPKTAQRYAEAAEASGRVRHDTDGPRGTLRYHVDEAVEQLMLNAEAES